MRAAQIAKAVAHLAAAAPALWLGWRIANDLFGADPVAEITHFTGDWALPVKEAEATSRPLA